MKKKIMAIAAVLLVLSQSVSAQINRLTYDSSTGECRIQGNFRNVDAQKAAVEVLKPGKNVNDDDAYIHVFETAIDEQGNFDDTFRIDGVSGEYLVRIGAGGQVYEKNFIYVSTEESEDYLQKVNDASSVAELTDIFESDYGRLKGLLGVTVDPEDKDFVYNALYNEINDNTISTFDELKRITAEICLINSFMGADENPEAELEKLFEYFDDEAMPAVTVWNDSTLVNDNLKSEIALKIQRSNAQTIEALQSEFVEDCIYTALSKASSKGRELAVVKIAYEYINADEYDYFSCLSEQRQINILSNISGSYSTVAQYSAKFDEAVQNSRENTGGSGNNSSGNSSGNSSIGTGVLVPGNVTTPDDDNTPETEPETDSRQPFNDLDGYDWAKTSIENLYNKNIINGKSSGVFAPGDNVKREEFLSMIMNALSLIVDDAQCDNFTDVDKQSWYYNAVASAYVQNIVNGMSDTEFGIGYAVSRQDAVVMCKNAASCAGVAFSEEEAESGDKPTVSYEYADVSGDIFSDQADIADYALDSVIAMYRTGVVNGMDTGEFAPENNMSRAEAAVIIDRLMKMVSETVSNIDTNTDMYEMMSAFGMYDADSTGLSLEITRGEAAKLICDILDLTPLSGSDYSFSDCGQDYEYSQYIYTVVENGYLSGYDDGKFYPVSTLSYNDAVRAIVTVLGYSKIAENDGGYPNGYLKIAANNSCLKNVTPTDAGEITKENFLRLFYNSFDVNVYELTYNGNNFGYSLSEDETLLSAYRNIYKLRGKVVANSYTGISGETTAGEGTIKIDGIEMTNANDLYDSYIGREVTCYYQADSADDYEILYMTPTSRSSVITLTADEIEEYENFSYTYIPEGSNRDRTITISNNANIIYNNKAVYDYTDDMLCPKVGSVEFVDANSDGRYDNNDTVIINSYRNIVVNYVDTNNEVIYDKYSSDFNLDLSEVENVEIKDKHGDVFGLRELREWDVLTALISPDNEYAQIVLIDESSTGNVNSINRQDDEITIGGETLSFAKDWRGNTDDIKLGNSVTVYWDLFGNVAAINTVVQQTNGRIMILTAHGMNDESGEEEYYIKSYSSDREITYYPLAERVKYNGTKRDAEDIQGFLDDQMGSAVMVDINTDGEISSITTAAKPGEDENRGFYKLNYDGESLVYGIEASNFGYRFRRGSEVYTIPEDPEEYGDSSRFSYNAQSFTNGVSYVVDGYSTTPNSAVADVIVYKAPPAQSATYDPSTGFVIANIEERLDDDDNVVTYVEGFNYNKDNYDYGTAAGYVIKDNAVIVDVDYNIRNDISVDDLSVGDCVRYSLDNGQISTIQLMYDYSEDVIEENSPTKAATGYRGYAYTKTSDGQYLTIADGKRPEEIDESDPTDGGTYLKSFWIRSQMVTVVDMTGKTPVVKKGSMSDVMTYKQTGSANGYSKVVMFSEWTSTIYGLVVYIED